MCVKTDIWLHETHAYENKCSYHKVVNLFKDLGKLSARGGCGGGGRMAKNNCLKIICNITILKDCKKKIVLPL